MKERLLINEKLKNNSKNEARESVRFAFIGRLIEITAIAAVARATNLQQTTVSILVVESVEPKYALEFVAMRKESYFCHTRHTIERKRIKSNPSKSKYVCIANGRNQTAGITHRRRCDDEGCVELPPLPSGSSEKYWIGAWLIICQSVLIYWLVFETSACESADCRLLAFVCAGSALGLEMYLCAFASARERLHKHHQFKSTVEYQSANKFRARVANTQSEEEQKNASRASCSATKACKKQWRQQASSSSNYLYDCDC